VQFEEVASAQAQWAKPSAEIRSNAQRFHIGVPMATKYVHHLQSKRQLLFQLNGIALSVVFQQVAIATIHQVQW
jgi:hypothetical protein